MEQQDYIRYWLDSSEKDFISMQNNFKSGNYDWALFIGHLVLEKSLKALWVQHNSENFPPRTHNLLKLAAESGLPLTEDDGLFLNRANSFNLETRYPDYKQEFYKLCTKEFAGENIRKIEQLYLCIKTKISIQ